MNVAAVVVVQSCAGSSSIIMYCSTIMYVYMYAHCINCGYTYRSQKEWQIRVKKLWKALPHDISDKLEKLYNPSSQKTRGRKPLPDSIYEVYKIFFFQKSFSI